MEKPRARGRILLILTSIFFVLLTLFYMEQLLASEFRLLRVLVISPMFVIALFSLLLSVLGFVFQKSPSKAKWLQFLSLIFLCILTVLFTIEIIDILQGTFRYGRRPYLIFATIIFSFHAIPVSLYFLGATLNRPKKDKVLT